MLLTKKIAGWLEWKEAGSSSSSDNCLSCKWKSFFQFHFFLSFFFPPCLCRLLHLNNKISFLHYLQNYSQLAPLGDTVILNDINDFNIFQELKYSYKNNCAETAPLCSMRRAFVQTKINLISFYFKVLTQPKGRRKASSQRHSVKGQEAMGINWNTGNSI